jgi:hypothetical protein
MAMLEHEVKYCEDALVKGSVLVSVEYTKNNKKLVEKTFYDCNADKVTTA